jgi:hypothetical protein
MCIPENPAPTTTASKLWGALAAMRSSPIRSGLDAELGLAAPRTLTARHPRFKLRFGAQRSVGRAGPPPAAISAARRWLEPAPTDNLILERGADAPTVSGRSKKS